MYFNCITFFCCGQCYSNYKVLFLQVATHFVFHPIAIGAPNLWCSRFSVKFKCKGCFRLLILSGSVGDNFVQTKGLDAQPGDGPPQSYRRRTPCRGSCGSSRSGIRTWHGTGIVHCFSAIFHILLLGNINIKTWTGNWAPLRCYFISLASDQIIWEQLPHSL